MMRKEYDFSRARRNPYARRLKRPITLRLEEETIAYFKRLAQQLELPYQSLINLYLRDCATTGRRLRLAWKRSKSGAA
jgi:predicted DNA binding CopG/RHH family protein